MPASAPKLSHHDVTQELTQFHAQRRRARHTAFFGFGQAGTVKVHLNGEDVLFSVVHADCELRLREALSEAERSDQPVALLVDYTDGLPLDVQGRVASGGLKFVSRERRLANLFGAASVAPALISSPLCDALLDDGRPFPGEARTTVDEHTAFRAYLARFAALPAEGDLSEVMLLEHAASAGRSPELAKSFADAPALERAVRAYLRSAVGTLGEAAFCAYLAGEGLAIAAKIFVLDALLLKHDEGYVRHKLDNLGLVPAGPQFEQGMVRWAQLASPLFLRLKDTPSTHGTFASKGPLHEVLAAADRELPFENYGPYLSSRFLAGGFTAAKHELGEAMAQAVQAQAAIGPESGPAALALLHRSLQTASEQFDRLSRHRLAEDTNHKALVLRSEMALRLLAYLRTHAEWHARLLDLSEHDAAISIAEHYAAEGGFVDWARRMARGGAPKEPLEHAVDAVLVRADALRDQLDALFAVGLLRWNKDRKLGALLPIEQALDVLGAGFLRGNPARATGDRKLLILVMDGMGWASAVEILRDLQGMHIAPLRFTPPQQKSGALVQPMIAALPTVTDVSRSALFAGKLLRPGELRTTAKDPERLANHGALQKVLVHGPRLMLRTEAEDNAGNLTDKAQKLIESGERAVAVVLNAVDDVLSSKPSYRAHYNRETIKALEKVLTCAKESARAVLLIADHGHVLSDRPRAVLKVEGDTSSRYRELGPNAVALPNELVSSDLTVHRDNKNRSAALLVGETFRYRDAHHLGEHGGASLAEVVTPALLIGSDDLRQQTGDGTDEQLDTVLFPTPAWWDRLWPALKNVAPAQAMPAAKPSRPPAKPRAPSPQLSLLEEPAPVVVEPVAAQALPDKPEVSIWEARIERVRGKLTTPQRQDLRNKVLPMLELLLDHGGRMSEDMLAGKLQEAVRNVGARAALMAEFFNSDGYDVVVHERSARQVRVERTVLEELFGEQS